MNRTDESANAMLDPRSCSRGSLGLIAAAIALGAGLAVEAPRCLGADPWGGAVGITSDYMVRGISRSNDRAALQLDLHYFDASGFVAGVFASNTQLDPGAEKDAELNGYLGFAWTAQDDWRSKISAGYYAYPWNAYGSAYNYAELDLDIGYQDWLNVSFGYSPNSPRLWPSSGVASVKAESAEVNVQRSFIGKLSGTGGIGYYRVQGLDPTGYLYWSLGAAYDLSRASFVVSYVDAQRGANALFYNAAVGGRWVGTIIWRF